MIFCDKCKSNNTFSGFRKIENGSRKHYVCRNCSKTSVKSLKIYTLHEIENELKWL